MQKENKTEYHIELIRTGLMSCAFSEMYSMAFIQGLVPLKTVMKHVTTNERLAKKVFSHYKDAVAYSTNGEFSVAQFAKLSKVEIFEEDIASQEIIDVVSPKIQDKIEWRKEYEANI